MSNWKDQAEEDAKDAVLHFEDEILEQLVDDDEASTEINDYSDSYHHESHIDKDYGFIEAAQLIGELDDYEESDTGLWEGQDMQKALSTCAAFTYGNAVYSEFRRLMGEINDHYDTELSGFDEEEHNVYEDGAFVIERLDQGSINWDQEEPPEFDTEEEAGMWAANRFLDESEDYHIVNGQLDEDATEEAVKAAKKALAQASFDHIARE